MRKEVLSVRYLSLRKYEERILSNISFSLYEGEVLGIVGINGVGKTMLAQLLTGIIRPDMGHIILDGKELDLHSPIDAIRGKIGYVGEEPQLLSNMTVAENLVLGLDRNPKLYYNRHALYDHARRILKRYRFTVNPKATVETLAYSQMKEVQIARQLANWPRVLIFDEFADSFSNNDLENFQNIFRNVTSEGLSIIYTTHNYEDVIRFADRILVLRNASIVAELTKERFDKNIIKRLMYGGDSIASNNSRNRLGHEKEDVSSQKIFQVNNLCATPLAPISLSLTQGEILGIAGLVGSGKSTFAQCIGGHRPFKHGSVYVDGTLCRISSPRDTIKNGIGLYFEKRNEMLLSDNNPIFMNISLGIIDRIGIAGIISRRKEELLATEYCHRFGIQNDIGQEIGELNHGTLTKIALARCMAANPRVLILDEPNRELDAEGTFALCGILEEIRRKCGIILILSKIDMLADICDRTLVMHEGSLIGELGKGELSYKQIIRLIESRRRYIHD